MSFSKINDYLEKYKVGVAYSFILVSILSMSSLFYKVANPIYKGLSAVVFVFIVSFGKSFKSPYWKCYRNNFYGNICSIVHNAKFISVEKSF